MLFQTSSVLASVGLLAASAIASPIGLPLQRRGPQCTNGAVVFIVRGSDPNWSSLAVDPAYNVLDQGMLATANAVVAKAGSGSYFQAVAYPAINPPTNGYADYEPSVMAGVKALTDDIISYVDSCPNGKIFVMGFSQGAQVVSTALGGSSPLHAHGRVTAVALFADPMYVAGVEPINAGSAAGTGVGGTVPNQQALYASLNQNFSDRLRSYCQVGDAVCNSGLGQGGPGAGNSVNIHIQEPETYQADATNWFLSKL